MTFKWTKAADAQLLETTPEDAAKKLGCTVEAAGRRKRRLLGAQYHLDREETSELRKMVNQAAWMERVVETLRDAAKVLPKLSVPKYTGSQEREHMPLFSDLQYGELVTLQQTGGLAEYNSSIAADRVGEWVAQLIAIQKQDKVRRCNIMVNGDLVEGHAIYPSQAYHLDQDVVHQAVSGGALFAAAVRELSTHYPEVVVNGVIGNHGRFDKASAVMSNMDYMLMKYAEALLGNQPNVRMIVHETWHALIDRFGVRYHIAHGDDLTLSFDGADKYQRRWRSIVGDFKYTLSGHHHQFSVFTGADWQSIVNGSFVGPSEHSLKTMHLGGIPLQLLFTIGKGGIKSTETLEFKTRTKPEVQVG